MKWRHTLALIAAIAAVTACTDEREASMDSEMILEVTITDDGVLALTEASEEQLEETIVEVGGQLDKPLRLRVSGPDGVVIRELAAASYEDLVAMIAQEGVADAAEIEKEAEALLAAIASGEIEIDPVAWRESIGAVQSAFESLDARGSSTR